MNGDACTRRAWVGVSAPIRVASEVGGGESVNEIQSIEEGSFSLSRGTIRGAPKRKEATGGVGGISGMGGSGGVPVRKKIPADVGGGMPFPGGVGDPVGECEASNVVFGLVGRGGGGEGGEVGVDGVEEGEVKRDDGIVGFRGGAGSDKERVGKREGGGGKGEEGVKERASVVTGDTGGKEVLQRVC